MSYAGFVYTGYAAVAVIFAVLIVKSLRARARARAALADM